MDATHPLGHTSQPVGESQPIAPVERSEARRPGELRSNGGPLLENSPRPWGNNGIGNYFEWRAATEAAFRKVPAPIAIRRARLAEAVGLTYFEYQLEILERGRYLQPYDTERIMEIKLRRPLRY